MAAGTRRMVFEVAIDDSKTGKALQNIDKNVGNTSKKFGEAGKAIKTAMSVVAVGGVVAFAQELAGRAAEIEANVRRTDTVFGDNAAVVKDWAEKNVGAFGESESKLLGMASAIGDLLVPIGITREEAGKMATNTLDAAIALSEWTGGKVTVEEAADAMTKAFLGEREELKKLGISLNQSDIDARLAATGQDELEGSARKAAIAVETQKLIFELSEDALRAYEEAGDGVYRSQLELKGMLEQAQDELAQRMIPALLTGFEAAGDFAAGVQEIIGWFEGLPTPVKNAALAIGGVTAALKVMYAHPVLAGLGLVAGAIIAIGDNAREQRENIDLMKESIEAAGGASSDAALMFLEGKDAADELRVIAAEAGLTLEDLAEAALGDEDALKKVETALKNAKDEGKLTDDQMFDLLATVDDLTSSLPEAKRELDLVAAAERRARDDAYYAEVAVGDLADKMEMDATRAASGYGDELGNLEGDLADLETQTDEAKQAAIEFADEQRKAADPAFALRDANDKYREALLKVEELENSGRVHSDEYREAALDLLEAQGDLNYATANYDASDSITSLMELGLEAGFTEDDILDLIAAIENLNRTPVTVGGQWDPGSTPPPGWDPIFMESGGMVPGPVGAPVPAVVHGGELVLNPSQQRALFSGGGKGLTVQVHAGTIVTENQLEDVMHRIMAKYSRRNGLN